MAHDQGERGCSPRKQRQRTLQEADFWQLRVKECVCEKRAARRCVCVCGEERARAHTSVIVLIWPWRHLILLVCVHGVSVTCCSAYTLSLILSLIHTYTHTGASAADCKQGGKWEEDEKIIIVELITNSSGWRQGGCSGNRLVWSSWRNIYHTVGWEPAHTHTYTHILRSFAWSSQRIFTSKWKITCEGLASVYSLTLCMCVPFSFPLLFSAKYKSQFLQAVQLGPPVLFQHLQLSFTFSLSLNL